MGDVGFSVSVIIPTLHAGRAFGTVLHRIMGQGRTPLEIICADSGSTDGTRHIVSQFALARFGDAISYKSLPFFIENAAVRRSVWRGIHFNEHLPVGADRVWARQVVLASYTIAYAPDAMVTTDSSGSLKAAYRLALLTGYTDQHYGDEGGTLWPEIG